MWSVVHWTQEIDGIFEPIDSGLQDACVVFMRLARGHEQWDTWVDESEGTDIVEEEGS